MNGLRAALWSAVGFCLCFQAVAKDIVVAQTLDLSGLSNLGKDFSNGVRTYFDAVNARGGVRGRRIQFVQLDDSGHAADASRARWGATAASRGRGRAARSRGRA